MAERLPVGASRNVKSPSVVSLSSDLLGSDVSSSPIDRLTSQMVSHEPDSNGPNSQLHTNGSTTSSNRNSSHNKQAHADPTSKNGTRTKDSESRNDSEWVEQDEPGVYITLTSLPGGAKDLKRVRFRYVIPPSFSLKCVLGNMTLLTINLPRA